MHSFLGFPNTFVRWFMQCVSYVSYSVMLNGKPSKTFQAAKGLKQGDPLSSLLFALSLEYLSRCLSSLQYDRRFKFHSRCKRKQITHLAFPDDLLLFYYGDLESVMATWNQFVRFSKASGLEANPEKCVVYFSGISKELEGDIYSWLGMPRGDLPFRYLGVSLSSKNLTFQQYKPLLERITARLSHWTNKFLSYGGRFNLVQIVIQGIHSF